MRLEVRDEAGNVGADETPHRLSSIDRQRPQGRIRGVRPMASAASPTAGSAQGSAGSAQSDSAGSAALGPPARAIGPVNGSRADVNAFADRSPTCQAGHGRQQSARFDRFAQVHLISAR